jgi:hypothetical protein
MLRVKNAACAPLRLRSMLSRPATGITCMSVTRGTPDIPARVTCDIFCSSRCAALPAIYSAACMAEAPVGSFFTRAVSSAISASVRSVSGGRTGPESRPITFMPALMMETA